MSLLATMGGGWLYYDILQFMKKPTVLLHPTNYLIKSGMTVKTISKQLHQHKIISNPYYFEWYARVNKITNSIKVGEYLINPGVTPQQLLGLFTSGQVVQYSLTVVEGWTFAQMLKAVQAQENLSI